MAAEWGLFEPERASTLDASVAGGPLREVPFSTTTTVIRCRHLLHHAEAARDGQGLAHRLDAAMSFHLPEQAPAGHYRAPPLPLCAGPLH